MMDLTSFRARYPEFRTATDGLVQTILDEAWRRINQGSAFGALADDAHGLVTAHLLLNAPYGRSQRLESTGAANADLSSFGMPADRYSTEFAALAEGIMGPHIFVIM